MRAGAIDNLATEIASTTPLDFATARHLVTRAWAAGLRHGVISERREVADAWGWWDE